MRPCLFAVLAIAGISSLPALAQGRIGAESFAAPVRIQAGEALLGEHRMYPSPVFHDIDGDGLLDLVVGDLRGRITFALRQAGEPIGYAGEVKLEDVDGKDIDFHNW